MEGTTSRASESALSNYKVGRTLGIGSFGKVKIAEHRLTGLRVAIKIIDRRQMKNKVLEEKARRELKILRLFVHPHIIRLYEVIETATDIYVVMEYCKYGELFDYIVEKGRLEETDARRFFQQIISGVECCHKNMIVHRDLKPENLLIDPNRNVKIADFGLSNVMRDGHFLKTSCGSPNYAAPEVISGKVYAGPEVDVWSCGVILYALLCGTLPFDDENIPNLFKKIKGGIYILPSYLSNSARDLIPKMLVVDPMKRLTIPQIRMHPWFKTHLPHYLSPPPAVTSQQARMVDEEILMRVVDLGFDRNQVIESLQNMKQNEATVTYYLLLDHQFSEINGPHRHMIQSTLNSAACIEPVESSADPFCDHYVGENMEVIDGAATLPRCPFGKWSLGIQSRASPYLIMEEVHRALRDLDVRWKRNGNHNIKCALMGKKKQSAGKETAVLVKFEIQIYKTLDERYLLDMQRLSGPHMLFLEFSNNFLVKLRVL